MNALAQIAAARPGDPPPPGRAMGWMALSVALAVIPTFFYLPLWAPLYFGACAFWRWRIERRVRAIPPGTLRAAIFALGCVLVAVFASGDGSRQALGFLIVLTSAKLLELRTRRDYIITALLAYFLILSGFFFNQSLPLALYTVVSLLIITQTLVMCCGATETRPSLRLAGSMCLQTLPVVVLLFVFFPRLEGQLNLFNVRSRTGLPGISENLRPGEIARLAESEEIALRAEIVGGKAIPPAELYWRGPVLLQCDGLAWSPGRFQLERGSPKQPPAADAPGIYTCRITIEPHENRWVFALDRPVAYATRGLYFTASGSVENRTPLRRKELYIVTSRVPQRTPLPEDLAPPAPAYLQTPNHLPIRVRQLAESWKMRTGGDGAAIVAAAQSYFRAEGFRYSLNPGTYEGPTAIEEFLFERKRGFCEHYAAAFATLMRAAGVPARLILGYQGGRTNWLTNHLTILQSDAHAWTEVWLPQRGWVRVDPTAEIAPERLSLGRDQYAALEQLGSLSPAERLQALFRLNNPTGWRWVIRSAAMAWDSVDHQWNLRVVGFGFDSQRDLWRDFGIDAFGFMGGGIGIMIGLGVGAGISALVLLLRSRSSDVVDRRASAIAKQYARFCARLARVGVAPRQPAEGPLDFASRAVAALPEQAGSIQQITDLYIRLRYGRSTGASLDDLKRAVREFAPKAARSA
ncbi:MAG: DUF3488 domain-containing protein [Verrucomicrobia bacterium]|nr:DUF3488 domain-containing protein [Verrucomicrobiota bacterium]